MYVFYNMRLSGVYIADRGGWVDTAIWQVSGITVGYRRRKRKTQGRRRRDIGKISTSSYPENLSWLLFVHVVCWRICWPAFRRVDASLLFFCATQFWLFQCLPNVFNCLQCKRINLRSFPRVLIHYGDPVFFSCRDSITLGIMALSFSFSTFPNSQQTTGWREILQQWRHNVAEC